MLSINVDVRLGWLVLTWLIYFSVHSALASLWLKRWVARVRPDWMAGYRLFFNLTACVLLLPPLVLTYWYRGPWLWQWTGVAGLLADALAVMAVVGFLWSLRWYDGAEFLGLTQWRRGVKAVEDQEAFHLSPLHRYVRHPWYSLALLLIWTRDMDPALLTTASMITLYFLAGSRLEEKKLLVYHGERYRTYRARVPSLIPMPGKHLTSDQARDLAAGVVRPD